MNSIFSFFLFGKILIYIALSIYLFVLYYLFIGLNKKVDRKNSEPFVSIIIVAKNEQENITECLKSLDRQKYHSFEIIFVDDNSSDSTLEIVKQLPIQADLEILKGKNPYGWISSKKACLELARKKAKGEILLFTDADCRPGSNWVKTIISAFGERTGFVAGFSPQTTKMNNLWDGILKIDSISAAIVSAGGIGWGQGITCTGRNIAVRAKTLNELGGYSATKNSLSGDDDFLLQLFAAHPPWEVSYIKDVQAVVPAIGPPNFLSLIHQKQRHISAGKKFNLKSQIGYAFYHGANYFMWLFFFIYPLQGILPLLLKLAADAFLIFQFANKVGEQPKLLSLFVWDFLYPVYHIASAPIAFLGKVKWC